MGRLARVNEQVRMAVSRIIQEELKDPRLGFVTVMRAEVSADLQHAHIHVSCMGSPEAQERTLSALASASGFVRKRLGECLRLRYTPAVAFHLDRSVDAQFKLQETLDRLHRTTHHETP